MCIQTAGCIYDELPRPVQAQVQSFMWWIVWTCDSAIVVFVPLLVFFVRFLTSSHAILSAQYTTLKSEGELSQPILARMVLPHCVCGSRSISSLGPIMSMSCRTAWMSSEASFLQHLLLFLRE